MVSQVRNCDISFNASPILAKLFSRVSHKGDWSSNPGPAKCEVVLEGSLKVAIQTLQEFVTLVARNP